MYNRKQRRELEKRIGLFKEIKTMSESAKADLKTRKQEAGKQIFIKNVEDSTNRLMDAEAERYSKKIAELVESGLENSEAEKVIEKNMLIQEHRNNKLAERRERQKTAYLAKTAKK